MKEGGFLGFGLHHEYPLDPKVGLGNLNNCLKGSDAILQRVCSQLSLQTFLRVIYEDDDESQFFMVQDIVDYSKDCQIDMTIGGIMTEYEGGKRVSITGPLTKNLSECPYCREEDQEKRMRMKR